MTRILELGVVTENDALRSTVQKPQIHFSRTGINCAKTTVINNAVSTQKALGKMEMPNCQGG